MDAVVTYCCLCCDIEFNTISELNLHMKLKNSIKLSHSGSLFYNTLICRNCDKEFEIKNLFDSHVYKCSAVEGGEY